MFTTTAPPRAWKRLTACSVIALLVATSACGGDDDSPATGPLESDLGRDYALFIRGAINSEGEVGRFCDDLRDDLVSSEATAEEKDDRERLVPVCDMAEDGDTDAALARIEEILPPKPQ